MTAFMAVLRKELADHFSSKRFIILFLLVYVAGLIAIYTAGQNIRNEVDENTRYVFLRLFLTSGGAIPPFPFFVSLFVPIMGIALGFDAMNRERQTGNLSRILAQPLFRDHLINAKFAAGVIVLAILITSITAIVAGLGLRMIGVPPGSEEILRLIFFVVVTIIYGAFWMALSVLFSILFERIATSALASIAIWVFFFFFMGVISSAIANAAAPVTQSSALPELLKNVQLHDAISRLSPTTLYGESIQAILMPELGNASPALAIISVYTQGMMPTPLPAGQSLLVVWPQLVTLIALSAICFVIGYIRFMKEEIRST
jgi:ABC-2 type transport system permease protein